MPDNPLARLNNEELVFTFDGKDYKIYPEKDISIDGSNLSEEFIRQPSFFAYVSILVSKADSVVKLRNAELEEAQAKAYDLARAKYEVEGKKATEGTIDAKVVLHPDVIAAKRSLMAAQTDYSMLKGLSESFKIRADMLIQLGMRQRAEIENGDLSIPNSKHKQEPSDRMKQALAKSKPSPSEDQEQ